jgi:hypothetical protein
LHQQTDGIEREVVIAIDLEDIVAGGLFDGRPARCGQSSVTIMADYPDKGLALGVVIDHPLKNGDATILRTVVDEDIVKSVVRLFEEGTGTTLDILFYAIDWHTDGYLDLIHLIRWARS